ncbi:ornithine cyclodeaminase ArcB [Gottschalkia acidurici 9a]|uniref:Ornithine cyclodeaminase ArcB n=1 Tax=Gottschalkia acidurici (strain ATCC 7906 / DSM 604 / BCRC 14475 / CIP 104303 / KCTC 5404 / NCIMB 10678 / 9a) TaxID=1128398 RepID=K0B5K7_GOTA9|nr:ornithine cyclodeaminase [Gottschalkia acidurici]AFS79806.1 ornithine cyclodeaminase ArcB [Gottschalkia acidurici 9a]
MEILALNAAEMKKAINIKDAIEADKLALESYSSGDANIPLRINLDIEEHKGQSLYMPGYSASSNALGVKLVSVYPNNIEKGISSVPALMLLIDDKTGFVNCMMDGTYLTQLRTGAVSGAATELLSKKDSNIFTLIGTGGQAALQLEAVLAVRNIRTAYVFDIHEQRQKEFAQEMQERFGNKYNVQIKECTNLESAIRESDIITSVTTAKCATFNGEWVKRGTHVNGVGSYTREMAEIDSSLILRADKIYCDTKDAIVESGDFVQMIQKGIFTEESITGELGQLLLQVTPGRETDDEITFFETTGNAVLDIVVAKKIYDCAVAKKIGKTICL